MNNLPMNLEGKEGNGHFVTFDAGCLKNAGSQILALVPPVGQTTSAAEVTHFYGAISAR